MKKQLMTFTVTMLLGVFSAAVASADEYKAPDVQLQKNKYRKPSIKKDSWDSNLGYKVEEDPNSDRGVASDKEVDENRWPDEEDPSRNPSSRGKKQKQKKKVESWKYED